MGVLEAYAQSLGDKPTAKAYVAYAKKYLDYAGANPFDKGKVQRFLRYLERDGYSPGSVANIFGIVRRVFVVNAQLWPFRFGEAPVVPEMSVQAPALHPDCIRDMILCPKLDLQELAFLALSTTYGLRRAEICNLTPEHLDLKSNLIFIETLKHGRQRYHITPAEIKPMLLGYDFGPMSVTECHYIFMRILHKASVRISEGLGFHSVRRTLNTLLIDSGLPSVVVHDFLRWKRQGMTERYYVTRFVGKDTPEVAMSSTMKVDLQVFEKHPFLPIWP